jgi:ribosomal protein S8E
MAAGFTLRGIDRARSQLPIKVARLALLEEEPRNFREAYQKLLVEIKLRELNKNLQFNLQKRTQTIQKSTILRVNFSKIMRILEQHK